MHAFFLRDGFLLGDALFFGSHVGGKFHWPNILQPSPWHYITLNLLSQDLTQHSDLEGVLEDIEDDSALSDGGCTTDDSDRDHEDQDDMQCIIICSSFII